MANKSLKYNAQHLVKDLEWLQSILEARLQAFASRKPMRSQSLPAPEPFKAPASIYQQFIQSFEINDAERVILLLGLLPHISPYLIERSLEKFGIEAKQIPDLGGIRGSSHGGMLPTGETALFILAGNDLQKRFEYSLCFSPRHKFYTKNILKLEEAGAVEPETSGVISVSKDVLYMLTNATAYQPMFNSGFPARLLTTHYEFNELILSKETEEQLDEIRVWLKHKNTILREWGFDRKFPDGYKCLFYGPPGTGKSLAAALIGKQYGMPVYRVDLSMVISKYIGETEKNLSRVFDAATNKNWILFFDEADALFGKRSNIQSSNDRFANQEVSYLLMRMEEFEGLAILATNLKSNIDPAFPRRFQSTICFPAPDRDLRKRLWDQGFSEHTEFLPDVDLDAIAAQFSLTGAGIMNVVRFTMLMALKKGNNIITKESIIEGIRKELAKESSLAGDISN